LLLTVTGRHVTITEALRAYAEEKTSRLPRFYNGINQVEVIVDGNDAGAGAGVEIIARGEHSNVFVARETGEDAYQCIAAAVHKLERQLRRKKTKERDDKHVGGREHE